MTAASGGRRLTVEYRGDAGDQRRHGGLVPVVDVQDRDRVTAFRRTTGSTRRSPGAFVWLGLHEPDEEQSAYVAKVFDLHPLAVEDVLHREERPKVERYEKTSFLILRAAQYVEHAELTEISEVVHTGFVHAIFDRVVDAYVDITAALQRGCGVDDLGAGLTDGT